jgi:hypothetical protein
MLVLMGKSASGKTEVAQILVKKYDFHSVVTYTTRKPRAGEIPDVTYHYITVEDFKQKIKEGFFAEWKQYIVNNEIWYYGSAKEDLENADDNTVIILTPDGVRDIKKNGVKATVVYLYANLSTIKKRLKVRNDKNDKANERIQRDLNDFKDAEILANKIVYNNDEMNIDNVAESVVEQYRKAIGT